MAANPTKQEYPQEPIAWYLTNKVIIGAFGAISLLLTLLLFLVQMGFNDMQKHAKESQDAQTTIMTAGDKALCEQINDLKNQQREENKFNRDVLFKMVETVAVLMTNQKARLERENQEKYRR